MSSHFIPVNMEDPRLPKAATRYQMFINGEWTDGAATTTFVRESPAHGIPVSEYPRGDEADVNRAVAAARQTFDAGTWSRASGAERAEVLLKAAALIRENAEALALVETLETGKPIQQSRGEIMGAASNWEYAAGMARGVHGESFNNLGDSVFGMVTREPLGVVGVITPWNFPFFIASERYPFVLAAGCTLVAKAAEMTSGTTLMMADLLQQAGLPDGVFNVVTGPGSVMGQALTEHEHVDMVSFTGSTPVGQSTIQGSASNIKKLALELGGKNPQIVFADADLDAAIDGTLFGMLFNGGQCCVSGSRLIVESSIHAEFCERLVERAKHVKIGDPLDDETQVGAIVDDRQFNTIMRYIGEGSDEGAQLLTGGGAFSREPGRFIQPTVFDRVEANMSIFREEIFGPVLCVTPFDDYDDAIRIANDSCYGLAGSIWTSNLDNAIRGFRDLKAGRLWVNTTISGGPELPVGGCKESGYGRESGSHGLEEYTEIKSVHIHLGKRDNWLKT